jgi:hypothetical protein
VNKIFRSLQVMNLCCLQLLNVNKNIWNEKLSLNVSNLEFKFYKQPQMEIHAI